MKVIHVRFRTGRQAICPPGEKHFSRFIPIFLTALVFLAFLLLSPGRAVAQEKGANTVTGSVKDSVGNPLPGVSVIVMGHSGKGTSSNADGRFIIDVPPNVTLQFVLMGYESVLVPLAGRQSVHVVLKEKVSQLTDVVITAYGKKQQKEAIVGAVTTVNPKDLKIPASNLTTALAGQVAGMIAYQRSGQPGQDNASFFVRGVTTFGYKQDPLILIDNVELTTTDLARLQVDDIASFSILKDASATSLYGARGANGVILVTTKEGKAGKAKINFRFENSMSQATRNLKFADPVQYMELYNEAIETRDSLGVPRFDQNKINHTKNGDNKFVYPAVDWMSELFKKRTNNQRANLSVGGGGEIARYYVAGSYSRDNGILKVSPVNNFNNNVRLNNYQLRSNVNINLTKSTELVVRLSGNFDEYTGPITGDASFSTDLYSQVMHTSPVDFPAFFTPDSSTYFEKHILFGNKARENGSLGVNPYAQLMRGYKNFSQSRMSAQLELTQNLSFITKGLNFRGMLTTNRFSFFDVARQYKPFYYQVSDYDKQSDKYRLMWLNNKPNEATEYLDYSPGSRSISTFVYMQGMLDYNRSFGDHTISSTLIGTRQQTLTTDGSSLQSSLPYRNLGLAGRATYSYLSRYFLEFNFGYNGSERFSSNNRFGFFPTIGASWVISNERMWEPLRDVVTRAKVRASYGLVGNDAISGQRFFYMSEVDMNAGYGSIFGKNNGYSRNGVAIRNYENRDVTWETSRQTNLGLELSLFGKVNFIGEVYHQLRSNILQQRASIPNTSGLEAGISANIGEAESRGMDLSLDYKQNFGKELWAAVRANLTYATNKYRVYEEPQFKEPWRSRVGNSIGQTYGFIAERLFVDDAEVANSPKQNFNGFVPRGGDIKYKDVNGDGEITERDMVPIGLPTTPELVYGAGFSVGYKSFDVSAFFQGLGRESFFIDVSDYDRRGGEYYNSTMPFIDNGQVLKAYADNHWSEQNQNIYAMMPRLSAAMNFNSAPWPREGETIANTWFMRNGAFLRLKSVEVGYTIPKHVLKRYHIENLRVYFNGLNLHTWSSFKLWDPEMGGRGLAYPLQKVFNIGVNINL
ncbi:TonB-dependent receptor [Chitinophaga caseinilytica]|uniref:TonB-dependent receptor n=1 Tax=Chitinophaga caseinilytica TaxID=2267521 RepID=A0ABZ2Z9Y8_9BACT